jgi:single-stranded-DNA-specific exonuclease
MNCTDIPACSPLPEKWELRQAGDFLSLARDLPVHPAIARILASRGYTTAEQARRFLHPGWRDFHDPAGLPDFENAITRLVRAVQRNERILIFGDYDVDGIAATAILTSAVCMVGGRCKWMIPNRLEGYGFRAQHVDAAKSLGVSLIVTADCGICSFDAVDTAALWGIDVIVTDHHLPESGVPAAAAVVNPNLPCSEYPNRYLCGAGIAFQMAGGLFRRLGIPRPRIRQMATSFARLAAIATIADVMPLVGENRALVRLGLSQLPQARSHGLRLLLESAGVLKNGCAPTARDVAFRVAPRINAAGRLADAGLVMNLLTTADPATAAEALQQLEELNRRRKDEQARVLGEILSTFRDQGESVLVFCERGWHRGVLGIVAARLVEQFRRPAIVLSEEDGRAHGSGRSVPEIDLHALLSSVSKHVESFGGHSQAVGVTIAATAVAPFRDALCARCPKPLSERNVVIDAKLRLADAKQIWPEVNALEPFGNSNPNPLFATRVQVEATPVFITNWVSKFRVRQNGVVYDIKHFGTNQGLRVLPGDWVDLAYSLQSDSWTREGFSFVLEALRNAI